MTETQLNLLGPPEPAIRLTDRQRHVLLQLRAGTAPMDVDEAGAIAHSLKAGRWAHSRDTRCDFCGRDGRAVLDALVNKGLAARRRPGRHIVYVAVIPTPDPLADDPDFAALERGQGPRIDDPERSGTADWRDRPVSEGGYGVLPEGF